MNTSADSIVPVGCQLGTPRHEDGSEYHSSDMSFRDAETGEVTSMATHITDPSKKEWDD